ncbi:MAG TPA: leucyl aminopeptidase [Bacteroidota bacterium]|nr:leucyl aminopeptidase [Bacteroidota bacterium]
MKISYQKGTLRSSRSDALVVFVPEGKQALQHALAPLRKVFGARLTRILSLENFSGKKNTLCSFPADGKLPTPRVFLVGLGSSGEIGAEALRRASSLAAGKAQGLGLKAVSFRMPAGFPGATHAPDAPDTARALAEGAILGTYRYDRYMTENKSDRKRLRRIQLVGDSAGQQTAIRRALSDAAIVCGGVVLARDLENAPGNDMYPETLAGTARSSGAKSGFRVTVWDEKRIRQTGFGGLLAVNSGSDRPPRFIIMELNGGKKGLETIVLVGKGVTFDSGGISIKPAGAMAEMKMDMSGAAAVIGTMVAASRLGLPVHLVGLVPATENMLSGSSMRPGDVITHYGGKTSEVDNTDAEGRLILADALAWASTYSPSAVIDLATLTGACIVALGHHATGMMGTDEVLMAELKAAGEKTFERVWPLPMFEEYEKQIRSDIADVKNVGGKWGGAITAGLFLKKFVGKYPWVHLDIAGTAILEESLPYCPKGGSGVGVRLLVEFLSSRAGGAKRS